MNSFFRLTPRIIILLALVLLPVLFFATRGIVYAALYCVADGATQRECFPHFKFKSSDETKRVNRSYLVEREPHLNKYWAKQNVGIDDQWGTYCNGRICIHRNGLFPQLQIVDRAGNSTAQSFPITIRIRGMASQYWHVGEWFEDGVSGTRSYSSLPDDLKGNYCSCFRSPPKDSILSEEYNDCGFNLGGYMYNLNNTAMKTTNPNDCYVQVNTPVFRGNTLVGSQPTYYRVKKAPIISLDQIAHDDTLAFYDYFNKAHLESTFKGSYDQLVGAEVENKMISKWAIYWRADWGKEDVYDTIENPIGKKNSDGKFIMPCLCSPNCRTGTAIQWDEVACYEHFMMYEKTAEQISAEEQANIEGAEAAKSAWEEAKADREAAERVLEQKNKAAIQQKIDGTYYPYKIYEPGVDTRAWNFFDYILTYDNTQLPEPRPAIQVKDENQIQKRSTDTFNSDCNLEGKFDRIAFGSDSKGKYTDYTMTARGRLTNAADNLVTSLARRRTQALGVVTAGEEQFDGIRRKVMRGTECRVRIDSPFFSTPFTYYYSTGDVEMQPVKILSFEVSAFDKETEKDKKAELGVCSIEHIEACLPREDFPETSLNERIFDSGTTPSRPNRSASAGATIAIVTDILPDAPLNQTVPVVVTWRTEHAADAAGVKVARTPNAGDINDRSQDKPFGGAGSYTFQDNEGLRPGECNKQECFPATYSFFLVATNDRAVTGSDIERYTGKDVNYAWSVSQKIDVKVTSTSPAERYGKCMRDAMRMARENTQNDFASTLKCRGAAGVIQTGVSALLPGIPVVPGLVGGMVGGICDFGNLMRNLEGFKKECAEIYEAPGETKEQQEKNFWGGFVKQFAPDFMSGLFSGFFGSLFKSVTCIPFLNFIVQFITSSIGGFIGGVLGNLLVGDVQINANSESTIVGIKAGAIVGGVIGGAIGDAAGGEVSKLLNFGNVKTDGIECKAPSEETPKAYFFCQEDPPIFLCLPSPGNLQTEYTDQGACTAECFKRNKCKLFPILCDIPNIGDGHSDGYQQGQQGQAIFSKLSKDQQHNHWASNLIQRLCGNTLGKPITKEQAMTIAIGSRNASLNANQRGGLTAEGRSDAFHCLWNQYSFLMETVGNTEGIEGSWDARRCTGSVVTLEEMQALFTPALCSTAAN